MAQRVGISPSSVVRIWQRLGITPNTGRVREEQRSDDAAWSALYIAPPEAVMVLAADPDRGPEADARTKQAAATRGMAMRGRLARLLSQRIGAPDAGELVRFLRTVQHRVPVRQEIHLICHGLGTRKIEAIRRVQEHSRALHLHFAPSAEFWLTLVERHIGPLAAGTPLGMALERMLQSSSRTRKASTWYQP